MNFLGIGPLELVLIIVLALIFLGPDELPVVMRKLAKFLKELQNLSADVSSQLREEFGPELEELSRTASELQEATKTAHRAQEFVRNPVKAVSTEAMQVVAPPSSTATAQDTPEAPEADEMKPEEEVAQPDTMTPRISTRPLTPVQEEYPDEQNDGRETPAPVSPESHADASEDGRSAS